MSSTDETAEETAATAEAREAAADEAAAAAPAPEPEPEEVREPDPLRDALLAELSSLMGDAIVGSHIIPGKDIWVRVRTDAWAEVANTVRTVMGARFFSFLSAIDWMPSPFGRSLDSAVDMALTNAEPKTPEPMQTGYAGGDTRFQVFARVTNIKDHWGITLKADAGDENPTVDTWTKVYAGADWHEREMYEMFGIDFVGHPGLRKLYLPTDFEGHPLRKDFPLLARMVKPWPGIVDVEPMPGDGSEDSDASNEEAAS